MYYFVWCRLIFCMIYWESFASSSSSLSLFGRFFTSLRKEKNGKKCWEDASVCSFFVTSDHIKQIRGMHNNVTQRLSLSLALLGNKFSRWFNIRSCEPWKVVYWFFAFDHFGADSSSLSMCCTGELTTHSRFEKPTTGNRKKLLFFPNTQHIMNDDVYNSRVEIEWESNTQQIKKDEFSASNGSSSMRSRWSSVETPAEINQWFWMP